MKEKFSYNSKLKTGDEVIVVSGKDLGKKGTLRKIIKGKNRAFVTGINMVKKPVSYTHLRAHETG